jgi:arylsulfatase
MRRLLWIVSVVFAVALPLRYGAANEPARRPPNVVVILADDLGFSDLGCYGGEIDTPHLDRLAAGGLRYTQGYNTARCWPSRSALLSGYYAQAIRRDALPDGDWEHRGGAALMRPAWARLLPELLAPAGYVSYHSGKWHIAGDPRRQGFARSFEWAWMQTGTEDDYFDPAGVRVDGEPLEAEPDFYMTTAIGEHAVACLRDHASGHPGSPFFQYVAFTAPHFPLHAPQDLVAKYRARYAAGWDAVRRARCLRIREQGLVAGDPSAPEPDVGPPYPPRARTLAHLGPGETDRPLPWDSLTPEQQEFQATKMAIHAAMVEMMDRAVGAIVSQLKTMGALDDTFILFASDNGASAEMMIRGKGHDPALLPGSSGTYLCLGPGWSTCANAPFRRHKTWVHEGGIATPWIVHWPAGLADRGELRRQPVHVIDVVPTVLELAHIAPPTVHDGQPVPPLHGKSFAASFLRCMERASPHRWPAPTPRRRTNCSGGATRNTGRCARAIGSSWPRAGMPGNSTTCPPTGAKRGISRPPSRSGWRLSNGSGHGSRRSAQCWLGRPATFRKTSASESSCAGPRRASRLRSRPAPAGDGGKSPRATTAEP